VAAALGVGTFPNAIWGKALMAAPGNRPSLCPMSRTLLVGYDGSRASRDALAYALDRAGSDGLVVVVHSYGPGPAWFGAPSYHNGSSDYEAAGRALIAELELPAEPAVKVELTEGPPAECLMRMARKWDADEIVTGSRGYFPLHTGPGSVSLALLRSADRPVVIIPARASSEGIVSTRELETIGGDR
jgi:nucleotide-binding universal stress UspA family protein